MRQPVHAFLLLLFLGGCTTVVTMPYDPTGPVATSGPRRLALGNVIDDRHEDSHRLGSIRGGFGNPLKNLTTEVPVKDVVREAFAKALSARNLLATKPDYEMQVTVTRLDCSRLVRLQAHAAFALSVSERASGRQVYADSVKIDNVSGSKLALDNGIFASTDELRLLALRTMDEAIDRVLDNPNLATALR